MATDRSSPDAGPRGHQAAGVFMTRVFKRERIRACDTILICINGDAVSLKLCPLGLEAAPLLDTQSRFYAS